MAGETKRVVLSWQDGLRFQGGEPAGPSVTIDGDNAAGPGPMLTLLLAAAACTGSDVVVILQKMRIQLRELRIEAEGVRRVEDWAAAQGRPHWGARIGRPGRYPGETPT